MNKKINECVHEHVINYKISFTTFYLSWPNSLYKLLKCLSVCVCQDVNEGGTNRNRCTQRLVILHAQTYL